MLSKAERDARWQELTRVFPRVPAEKAFDVGRASGPEIKHGTSLLSCVHSADGSKIIVAGGGRLPGCDCSIRVFDAQSGRETLICRGHIHGVYQLAIDPNTGFLASASEDYSVILWNLEIPDAIFLVGGDPIVKGKVGFAGKRNVIAIGEHEAYEDFCNSAFVVDLETGKELFRHTLEKGREVSGLLIAADGKSVIEATGNYQGSPPGTEMICWQLDDVRRGWLAGLSKLFASARIVGGHEIWRSSIAGVNISQMGWLRGEERIVAAIIDESENYSSGACLIDAKSGNVLAKRIQPGIGSSVAVSPDGSRVAIAYGEGGIELVRSEDLAPVTTIVAKDQKSGFCSVQFSPDGKTILGGTATGILETYRLPDSNS